MCHAQFFNHYYYGDITNCSKLVEELVTPGVPSKMCDYVHKHMNEGKITANLWPMCESAQGVEFCKW
jgi:hypothetical protein